MVLGINWYWWLLMPWGYLILGVVFDHIQYKCMNGWNSCGFEPTVILWFLWPVALAMVIVIAPFALIAKLFE